VGFFAQLFDVFVPTLCYCFGGPIVMLRGSICSVCHCMSQISFVLSDLFVTKPIVLFLLSCNPVAFRNLSRIAIASLTDLRLLIASVMSSAYAIDFGAFLTGLGDEWMWLLF